ncbi:MAG: arsenosugar biosynthesis radical SAM protein ArsS [Spirochaetota bacterium]|nr:arsenosugar biosynthesis radical SAM protein ArsS [Spirochaetota bacterium]
MNNFWEVMNIKKTGIDIIQINLGNRCNLSCNHCHIGASPRGEKNMERKTAEKIILKLKKLDVKQVDLTGGEPVMNPNLQYFIKELSDKKNISVRTNLVSLNIPDYSNMLTLFKEHNVTIIGSLPSVFEKTTDSQRGKNVFKKSIQILKKLNNQGYGNGFKLDLVYNPVGDYLPPDSKTLEADYRELLKEVQGIKFNELIAMVNVPINKFRKFLEKEGTRTHYEENLLSNYNHATLDKIMCRNLLSVDYEGYIYDCDFNLACGKRIKGFERAKFWDIDFTNFIPEISFDNYCYACTVNTGSSCHGALLKDDDVKEKVQRYYGETLNSSSDLQTNACCTTESIPQYVKDSLKYINDEIMMKYYGCGSPIPLALEGLKALDLGCGTGRDTYLLSRLVGEKGFVYGFDMTNNQLKVAKKHLNDQMNIFGYKKKNVSFIMDYIENLEDHFKEESLDLVISNCVINLTENKENVIKQVYKALRNTGEFYFSDVYADRRVPKHIIENEILYGECLGGALYYNDFERIARASGFTDTRIMSKTKITIQNPEIEELVENINFYSITYRLWKLEGLEDACEDYGHIAIYKGGIPYSPYRLELDCEHIFYKNKPERVCGNTAKMLQESRFAKYFEIIGDFKEHFGAFEECGNTTSSKDEVNDLPGECCP